MGFHLSDDQISETLAAIEETRTPAGEINYTALAKRLGLARSSATVRVQRLAEKGHLGFAPVLPGFAIKSASSQLDEDGGVVKSWVRQTKEPSGKFNIPVGHSVKGVSALVDHDNRVLAQWIKTRAEDQTDTLVDAIKTAFDAYQGRAAPTLYEAHADEKLLTAYVIGDHHLGMFSWSKETGSDYDLKIAEDLLLDSMGRLVQSAPASKTAIVLNLGDFFHADDSSNRTARSGNPLDVDTRYAKVLQTGVKLMIRCIDLALAKHEKVIVRCLPGNHDAHTALALSVALAAFYSADERIFVDTDPGKFFKHIHGRVMIAATHGDMAKPEAMPGIMASMWPKEWGSTVHRVAYFGHVHHKSKGGGEHSGVVWETFQVLAPKDAWHTSLGYSSGRSMVAITHHADHGEYCRHTVSVA